jgi:thymidylate kinase
LRKEFLNTVQNILANYTYAVVKPSATNLDGWSEFSDIDIVIDESSAIKIWEQLEKDEAVKKVRAADKSYMFQLYFILNDDSIVAIDFIFQHKHLRKHLMTLEEMLHHRKQNQSGLWVMDEMAEFEFIWLFYMLNKSELPEKYVQQFNTFNDDLKYNIIEQLNAKYGTVVVKFEELFALQNFRKIVLKNIFKKPENKGLKGLSNRIDYYLDLGNEFFLADGLMITFSGVDGAGKSTVIENLKHKIDKQLRRRVVVLRHRPSVLPIINAWFVGKEKAEELSVQKLPRQGENKSSISSFIRFVYYFMDYFFGQFWIELIYVSRGYIVLYDRYYFDFINDSKRSNIKISKGFTKWFYKFLIKPDLNYFLTAPSEEILKRKQELSAETIDELTAEYKKLFSDLQTKTSKVKYEVVNNIVLDETIENIFNDIKTKTID